MDTLEIVLASLLLFQDCVQAVQPNETSYPMDILMSERKQALPSPTESFHPLLTEVKPWLIKRNSGPHTSQSTPATLVNSITIRAESRLSQLIATTQASSHIQTTATKFKDVDVISSDKKSDAMLIYITVSVTISSTLLVLLIAVLFYCTKKKKRTLQVTIASQINDDSSSFSAGADGNVSAEYVPLKPSEMPPLVQRDIWEIPRKYLQLGIKLGEGAFGFVFKGTLKVGDSATQTVAVKTIKDNASASELQDLLSELEIMKNLKPHPNVVNLVGAIRNEVENPLVLVELVPFGDLLGYLRKLRGVRDTCYYDPDYVPVTSFKSEDLLKFAIDSAKGMEYLSVKKIVHRDLAARNVLVGLGGTCKITDFGMARNLRQNEIYMRTTRGLIPVKWTAIESIVCGLYTTKSDVWSFGVLLFEILTVGGCPYPGMNGYQVREFISKGNRLSKPLHVDNEVYAIMLECWQSNPRKRPTFKQLVYTLKRLELHHKEYINLSEYNPCHYENLDSVLSA